MSIRSALETLLRTGALAALALVAASGCGPVPGGALRGTVTPVPSDWSSALPEGRAFCEIESRAEDPHSIQLECFLHEGELFVQSHRWALAAWWPVESWAEIWIEHPEVRVRIDEKLFELRAVQVTEPERREAVLRYRGYEPVPAGIVVFRLEPRVRLESSKRTSAARQRETNASFPQSPAARTT